MKPLLIISYLSILLLSGCATAVKPVENISCVYKFSNVEKPEDKERIAKIISKVAAGDVQVTNEETANPQYHFTVKNLKSLDEIQPQLLYDKPNSKKREQVFNCENQTFAVGYSTIMFTAKMEVLVRFQITPGATLFYKPQGQKEEDITDKVDNAGKVALNVSINKGQEYIYGRTVSGDVVRHIRINIYTQQVEEIKKNQY